MTFANNPLRMPPANPSNILSVKIFKGLNMFNTSSEIDNDESPDMLNIVVNDQGMFENRKGYSRMYPTSLGVGAIKGMFYYKKSNGTNMFLMSWGGKLYKVADGVAPVEISTTHGLSSFKVRFLEMNDYVWITDNVHYYRFDGTTVVDVESIATIPITHIGRSPDGLTTNWVGSVNYLQPGFQENFSGTATDTVYHLSLDHLDATPVKITANNVVFTEGTQFTVNRTTGAITFVTSPGFGVDNVEIIAYKTYPASLVPPIHPSNPDYIKSCSISFAFGGRNDTRMWLAGDGTNNLYYSDYYDPSMFAYDNFFKVGTDDDPIMGFSIQYDTLIIQKRYSKWQVSYVTDPSSGNSTFTVKPINDVVGCIAQDSIQTLHNNPVTLTEQGVYMLTSSNVRDERNVQSISLKVDRKLLMEANLKDACSIDFDDKYILVVNSHAYVYDYVINAWFYWENIKASCFLIANGTLYFGSDTDGLVYKFLKSGTGSYLDDGVQMPSYWASKVFDLGTSSRNKLVEKLFYSVKPNRKSNVQVYYKTDELTSDLVSEETMNLFSYATLSYATFTYRCNQFPVVVMAKIKAKKIMYFQVIFKCDRLDGGMQVLNIDIKYTIQGYKK